MYSSCKLEYLGERRRTKLINRYSSSKLVYKEIDEILSYSFHHEIKSSLNKRFESLD